MKKQLLILSVITLATVGLVSCGGPNTKAPPCNLTQLAGQCPTTINGTPATAGSILTCQASYAKMNQCSLNK